MNIPEGYAQINLYFTGTGLSRTPEVTFGVQQDESMDAGDVADAVWDAWGDAGMYSGMPNTRALTKLRAKLGPNEDGPFAFKAGSIPGGWSGGATAPNLAVLCKKRTAFGGKKGSGRFYLPGLGEDLVDPIGQIRLDVLATIATNCTAFLDALTTNMVPMHLLSSSEDEVPKLVTSLGPELLVATQRRRLRK